MELDWKSELLRFYYIGINYRILLRLDKLLVSVEQQFKPGRVWEICGPTGVGKTQLMYTLMVNFVWKHDLQALFIDLKRDFSGKRIGDMLAARETDSGSCERVLKAIRVAEATTSRELIDILQNFYQQLAARNKDAQRTKLVVIDSLPECFYSFRGKKMAMLRKSLITELACCIRKLSVHGIAFVVGNMSFFQKEEGIIYFLLMILISATSIIIFYSYQKLLMMTAKMTVAETKRFQ